MKYEKTVMFALLAALQMFVPALAPRPAFPQSSSSHPPTSPPTSTSPSASPTSTPPPVTPAPASGASNSSSSISTQFYIGEKLHLYDVVTNYGSYVSNDVNGICSLPGADVRVMKIESGGSSDQYGPLIDVVPLEKGALPKGMASIPGCDPNKYLQPGGGEYDVYDYNLEESRYNAISMVTGVLVIPYKFHFSDRSATVGTTIGGYIGYQTSFQNLFTVTPIISAGLALVSGSPAQTTSSGAGTSSTSPTSKASGSATNAGVTLAIGLIGTVSNEGKAGLQYGLVTGIDWVGKSANYAYEGKPWLAVEIGYNFSAAPTANSSGSK